MKTYNKAKRIKISLLFLFSAFVFLLLFSWSTSPLFDYKACDSSIFQAIGKFSNKGLDFYKDLFDHKGPIMFLVDKIGYLIVDSKIGVFIVQIVFWFFTLCGTYKIVREFFKDKASVILAECSLLLYALYYSGVAGNSSEEYILPFLVWSIYFAICYIKRVNQDKQYDHNPKYAFFYGLSFAIGAFSRLTNALPICISILVILCILIYKKRWKNILQNAAGLILGVLVITIPIALWFAINGTFYEMIDATFIANIKYSQVHRYHYTFLDLAKFFARYRLIIIVSLLLGAIGLKNKKTRLLSILVVAHMVGSIVIDLTTPMFSYYAMIWTPTIVLTLCLAYKYEWLKWISRMIVYCSLAFILVNGVTNLYDCYLAKQDTRLQELRKDVLDIKREIPKKDYDKVVAYNTFANVYLELNIAPCYRNFVFQDFHSSFNEKTKAQIEKDLRSLKAKYIIEDNDNKKSVWDNYINNHYYDVKKNKLYTLKKIK